MEVYIIRHGQTDWNKEKMIQGQTDIDLNEYGRELAIETGEALKEVHFDYVFSSPLVRSVNTAKLILGKRDIQIVTDDRLKEIAFGVDEGKKPFERRDEFKDFFESPDKYVPGEGGESFYQLAERTKDFIESVLVPLSVKEPDARVAIFGHGAMNKALNLHLMHLEIKDIWSGIFQKNCCVSIYNINGHEFERTLEAKIFYEEKD